MKTATIRELKHDTSAVLKLVAQGESVEVRRYRVPVAILSSPKRSDRPVRPDYMARLTAVYGTKVLPTTATDLISESRGAS